jgi:hypothetical protein
MHCPMRARPSREKTEGNTLMMTDAVRLALTLAVLYAAHQIADHWIQTHTQACGKAAPGWAGWRANLAHVATYTATLGACLTLVSWLYRLDLHPGLTALGLTVNAITHAIADRRAPLRALALAVGKRAYWDDVPGGPR